MLKVNITNEEKYNPVLEITSKEEAQNYLQQLAQHSKQIDFSENAADKTDEDYLNEEKMVIKWWVALKPLYVRERIAKLFDYPL